jgi:hypothetical protein
MTSPAGWPWKPDRGNPANEAFDLASAERSDAARFCNREIFGSKHARWDFDESHRLDLDACFRACVGK